MAVKTSEPGFQRKSSYREGPGRILQQDNGKSKWTPTWVENKDFSSIF